MKETKFEPNHVALAVSSLEKSMKWYAEMFGFKTETVFEKPELKLKAAIMKLRGFSLELFQPEKPVALPENRKEFESDSKFIGIKHFCLTVKDIQEAFNFLKSKQAKVDGKIVDGKTGKYFFVKDPDGILIEIKQLFF